MVNIIKYTADKADHWNAFVDKSKNGTFLHDRRYMDYHADRFQDSSLMFYDSKQQLCAILPANIVDDTCFSHQGLTYGGLITSDKTSAMTVIECFSALKDYLIASEIHKFVYKSIPYIYHRQPADEDLYAIFSTMNARLLKRDLSSVIPLSHPIRFTESRRSGIRKACRHKIEILRKDNFSEFWQVLSANLMDRYNTKPVHSIDEIELLHSRFPDNIQLYVAQKDNEVVGGTVLYIIENVVHTQYISASPIGKEMGANDLLFDYIINSGKYSAQKFFDFGISTDPATLSINHSLLFQKEHFGGRAICYDTYEAIF